MESRHFYFLLLFSFFQGEGLIATLYRRGLLWNATGLGQPTRLPDIKNDSNI